MITDERGLIIPELNSARARTEMLRALEELLHDDNRAAEAWTGWRMELTDAAGVALFSINLDEVDIDRSRLPLEREP